MNKLVTNGIKDDTSYPQRCPSLPPLKGVGNTTPYPHNRKLGGIPFALQEKLIVEKL